MADAGRNSLKATRRLVESLERNNPRALQRILEEKEQLGGAAKR